MPFEAEDLDRLVKTLESMLDRFKDSGSISLRALLIPVCLLSVRRASGDDLISRFKALVERGGRQDRLE